MSAPNSMPAPSGQPVVEARDLRRVYEIRRGFMRPSDHLQAVGGVSFSVHAGKTLAVVGESGCGKSTLARMVSLIETPTGGKLRIKGIDARVSTQSGGLSVELPYQMLEFFQIMTAWYEEMKGVPLPVIKSFLKLGSKAVKVLGLLK